ADGKLVVAGVSNGVVNTFALARFKADGSLDANNFGSNGLVTTQFSVGSVDQADAVAIQPDGNIVVAGYTHVVAGLNSFALARYLSNGSPDPTFNGNGLVTIGFGGVAGNNFAVARCNADGTQDSDFNAV